MAALELAAVAAGLDGLVKAGGAVANGTKAAVNATNAILEEQVKSIAEKARRSIMMYKVLLSAGIRDAQIAEYITNYLEHMYATFTLISLGFNPNAGDNEGLNKIVDSISAESFDPNGVDAAVTKRAYSIEMMYLADEIASKGPRIGRRARSEEGIVETEYDANGIEVRSKTKVGDYDYEEEYRKEQDELRKQEKQDWEREDRERKNRFENERAQRENEKQDWERASRANHVEELRFIDNVAKNSDKRYPTIINMNCYINGNKVSIPIAVKCNAYPVGSEELRLVIESGVAGKPSQFLRKLKWKSGEIGTLDYIFNLDIAKRDKKMYAKLGRNPWYRELQARKAASNSSKWGRIFNHLGKPTGATDDIYKTANNLANLNGYRGEIPPTASLVVTTDDLVAATRLNLDHFQKNDGFIAKFMKDSFLLCFGIVDLTAEQVKFFFLGYTSPFILSFKELQNANDKDANKTMLEIMNNLSRKV